MITTAQFSLIKCIPNPISRAYNTSVIRKLRLFVCQHTRSLFGLIIVMEHLLGMIQKIRTVIFIMQRFGVCSKFRTISSPLLVQNICSQVTQFHYGNPCNLLDSKNSFAVQSAALSVGRYDFISSLKRNLVRIRGSSIFHVKFQPVLRRQLEHVVESALHFTPGSSAVVMKHFSRRFLFVAAFINRFLHHCPLLLPCDLAVVQAWRVPVSVAQYSALVTAHDVIWLGQLASLITGFPCL